MHALQSLSHWQPSWPCLPQMTVHTFLSLGGTQKPPTSCTQTAEVDEPAWESCLARAAPATAAGGRESGRATRVPAGTQQQQRRRRRPQQQPQRPQQPQQPLRQPRCGTGELWDPDDVHEPFPSPQPPVARGWPGIRDRLLQAVQGRAQQVRDPLASGAVPGYARVDGRSLYTYSRGQASLPSESVHQP
jgi:hypothetical protein